MPQSQTHVYHTNTSLTFLYSCSLSPKLQQTCNESQAHSWGSACLGSLKDPVFLFWFLMQQKKSRDIVYRSKSSFECSAIFNNTECFKDKEVREKFYSVRTWESPTQSCDKCWWTAGLPSWVFMSFRPLENWSPRLSPFCFCHFMISCIESHSPWNIYNDLVYPVESWIEWILDTTDLFAT